MKIPRSSLLFADELSEGDLRSEPHLFEGVYSAQPLIANDNFSQKLKDSGHSLSPSGLAYAAIGYDAISFLGEFYRLSPKSRTAEDRISALRAFSTTGISGPVGVEASKQKRYKTVIVKEGKFEVQD